MHSEPQIELKIAQAAAQRQWQAFGLVVVCLGVVLAVFWRTFLEIVHIWDRSPTFTHGWLVLPAFLYLVWQQRAQLAATPIRPFPGAIVIGVGAGFVWLLGELSSSLTPSFFAMVTLVPVAITAVFGWRWAKVLSFPLAFLYFAVPFGQVFVPTLMEWTADFTVLALQSSGVPVLREGQNFVIPSGHWSVVEACSGIRYLIASMVVGALFAWTMYRSMLRRMLFFGASIVVPVVANWLRAYLIVMLGHLSGNRIAVGVDHLIYGWIFFGVVMFILFAVGAIWREDHLPVPKAASAEPAWLAGNWFAGGWRSVGFAAAAMIAVLVIWPLSARVMLQPHVDREISDIALRPAAGWAVVPGPLTSWRPQLEAPTHEQVLTFEREGRRVGIYVGFYRNQRQGAELVNSENQLLRTSKREMLTLSSSYRSIEFGDRPLRVRTARMRGPEGTIIAWQWYWLGDASTTSDARAKFDLAFDRLLGRDDTSAWVTLFVVNPADPDDADQTLAGFVRDMGSDLEASLKRLAGR